MVPTADTIWAVPAYLPYLQPALTDEGVILAEGQIGHKLPAEYVALLKKQNGGYIRFSLPDMAHSIIAGVGPNFPSLIRWSLDWYDLQEHISFPLRGLAPFDGDGHWYLCLDYRVSSANPSVTYADIELDRQLHIADSFADYLSKLQIDVGHDYVVEAVSDIEAVKDQLSASLGIRFEPPDTWAYGYPTHRAGLGTKNDPQWVWISPNDVPRGFARSNDPKYMELKDLMPGYAKRFPELPPDSYILSATDGVRSKVVRACTRSGLIVRPLREYVNGG